MGMRIHKWADLKARSKVNLHAQSEGTAFQKMPIHTCKQMPISKPFAVLPVEASTCPYCGKSLHGGDDQS
jgi:hypothetical protein